MSTAATATAPALNGHAGSSTETQNKIQPNDVGWQFVPQYYAFVNKQPHRLHCFYNKQSTFIHGEEGEEATPAYGQHEIHERITSIGYNQCKVYVHSIDSQSSANGGIIILVIGEMTNNGGPWRKFTQTFFLAEQPHGYFVLNDIFRYLREDVDEDEEEAASVDAPSQETSAPVAPVEAAAPVEETPAPEETQTTISTEPSNEPAHPDPTAVPEEAVVAAVPDEPTAPEDPPAVEEPTTTSAPVPIEEPTPKAPVETSTSSTPAPILPNGNASPAVKPPMAAPVPAPAPAKPAAPKSWASMAAAASAKPAWGAAAPAVTVAPAAAPPKKEEAAPAAAATPAAAPAASTSGQTRHHPFYENAMRVQTPHCFVKLPNWSAENQAGGDAIDENTLKAAAIRFGEVTKVEIVKSKACAFVEFKSVESARKAIVASLAINQGGEGGVKVGSGDGKLNFETRKEKDERRPKIGGAPGVVPQQGAGPQQHGGQGQGQGNRGQQNRGPGAQGPGGPQQQGERGQGGAGRGRAGGNRGRGAPGGGQQGDRQPLPQKQ